MGRAVRGEAARPVYCIKCTLLAEGVEKVRTIKFCATIVRATRSCSKIDSTKSRTLNHCFKNSDPREFFNTLGYKQTCRNLNLMSALPPTPDIPRPTLDFRL